MARWTVKTLAILAVLLLVPVEALAGICFSTSGFPTPVILDFDLMSQGQFQPGTFFAIGGAITGWCSGTTPALMSGTVRHQSNGKFQVGVTIHAARVSPGCVDGVGEGEVEANLQSGSMVFRTALGSAFAVTLSSSGCPAL